jgi:RNA polymerase sigma factor (sigma-70 family)
MTNDLDLLKQFARENSQDAFREIVRRHLDLVYSAALRQVRSPQLAEEIAQSVFADLARNADKLRSDTVLTSWIYAVTRRTAIDVIRKESRRQLREQIAVEMNAMNTTADEWTRIAPLLDDAMAALEETDRAAVLLRFFENKSLREVGEALGTGEDAAQKRVSRAIERLRDFFSKQKVTVGAAGLVTLISANAVQAAPAGLAAVVSTGTMLSAVHQATAIGITKTLAMTTIQKTVMATAFVAAIGTGVFEARKNSELQNQIQALHQQQTQLAVQIQDLQRERDDLTNQSAGLLAENTQLKSNSNQNELLRLRSEVGVLRAQLADGKNSKTQSEKPPLSSAREYFARANQDSMNHEYEAQLEDLDKTIELDPNMAEAYMERGNLYALNLPKERGGYEKAVADYTRCLEIKPNDASSRWNRANDYTYLGKYEEAIADWTIYINGDTDFSHQLEGKTKSIAAAHLWRGRVYQMYLHDYSKAIVDYTAAIQLNPNIENAYRMRGQCYESLGETEKAGQDFAIEPKHN